MDNKSQLKEATEIKPLLKDKDTLKKDNTDIKEKKEHKKNVVWDIKTLEEQELDRKLHPVLMKCNEPKTPYEPYEGDDEYLKKLNEVNKKEMTSDVLNDVIAQLNKKQPRRSSKDYLEIEVINQDGSITKELVEDEHHNSKEFLKKRKIAYKNEFLDAKKFYDENNEEEKEKSSKKLMETTLKNTLMNKYIGKIDKFNKKKKKKK